MQSDPLGLAAGANTYNYVGMNPLNAIDPLGLYASVILVKDVFYKPNHVALNLNGKIYNINPTGISSLVFSQGDIFNNESEFLVHYYGNKGITLKVYDLDLTKEEEDILEKSFNNINGYYGLYYNNCGQFIGSALEESNLKKWGFKLTPSLFERDLENDSLFMSKVRKIYIGKNIVKFRNGIPYSEGLK